MFETINSDQYSNVERGSIVYSQTPQSDKKKILTPTKHTNTRVGINTKYRIKNPQTQMNDNRQEMNS